MCMSSLWYYYLLIFLPCSDADKGSCRAHHQWRIQKVMQTRALDGHYLASYW